MCVLLVLSFFPVFFLCCIFHFLFPDEDQDEDPDARFMRGPAHVENLVAVGDDEDDDEEDDEEDEEGDPDEEDDLNQEIELGSDDSEDDGQGAHY